MMREGATQKLPNGEATILSTGERCYYNDMGVRQYLGELWEFTGRIRYDSRPDWINPYCYLEVIWEEDEYEWVFWKKRVQKTAWIIFNSFKFEYHTTTTILECTGG